MPHAGSGGHIPTRSFSGKFVACGFIALLPLFIGSAASSQTSEVNLIDQLQGYYGHPAQHCTMLEENANVPCIPPPTECLIVKKIDSNHAAISLHTVQDNGDECGIGPNAIAELRGNKLLYRYDPSKDGISTTPAGSGVLISIQGGKIIFEYDPDPISVTPFCGLNASLDSVSFALSEKQPINSRTCSE